MSTNDSDGLKNIIKIAIIFMVGWGLLGLFNGDGFFGGIGREFDAIGDLVAMVVKGLVFIGIIWFIFEKLKNRDKKSNGS